LMGLWEQRHGQSARPVSAGFGARLRYGGPGRRGLGSESASESGGGASVFCLCPYLRLCCGPGLYGCHDLSHARDCGHGHDGGCACARRRHSYLRVHSHADPTPSASETDDDVDDSPYSSPDASVKSGAYPSPAAGAVSHARHHVPRLPTPTSTEPFCYCHDRPPRTGPHNVSRAVAASRVSVLLPRGLARRCCMIYLYACVYGHEVRSSVSVSRRVRVALLRLMQAVRRIAPDCATVPLLKSVERIQAGCICRCWAGRHASPWALLAR